MEIENRKFDNSFVEFVVKYELEQRVSVTPAATVVAMAFPKAVVMALPAARTTTAATNSWGCDGDRTKPRAWPGAGATTRRTSGPSDPTGHPLIQCTTRLKDTGLA